LANNELYGDKAYQRPDAKDVRNAQNLTVLTPVKKQKGQKIFGAARAVAFNCRIPY
jgi:hypothetical protein